VVSSTRPDPELDRIIADRRGSWNFASLNKPGDVTEVTLPLVFNAYALSSRRPDLVTSTNNQRPPVDHSKTDHSAKLTKKSEPDYLKKMSKKTTDAYQTYLKLRDNYVNSPTFYFDMADWFYKNDDRETALRVLTSIAELGLENAPLYRMLGYRFKEYGEYTLQKFVTQKVVEWRPIEPQSYRDYALALADNGEPQAALDSLYGLLARFYSPAIVDRSRGIEEVVVTEINHLLVKYPNLNTSMIEEERLLVVANPVDVRVVSNWNMDNVTIDFFVIDPNNEESAYWISTGIGGRKSAYNRSGYGPEQFVLKNAKEGKYTIHVSYVSAREFATPGPATVMLEIYTKYAGEEEKRQVVCLQLSGRERLKAAEFEIGKPR
jgi:tetratricopeptide (TPR) repeat protein